MTMYYKTVSPCFCSETSFKGYIPKLDDDKSSFPNFSFLGI